MTMPEIPVEAILAEVLQPRLFCRYLQQEYIQDDARKTFANVWLWGYLQPFFMHPFLDCRMISIAARPPTLRVDGESYAMSEWVVLFLTQCGYAALSGRDALNAMIHGYPNMIGASS